MEIDLTVKYYTKHTYGADNAKKLITYNKQEAVEDYTSDTTVM